MNKTVQADEHFSRMREGPRSNLLPSISIRFISPTLVEVTVSINGIVVAEKPEKNDTLQSLICNWVAAAAVENCILLTLQPVNRILLKFPSDAKPTEAVESDLISTSAKVIELFTDPASSLAFMNTGLLVDIRPPSTLNWQLLIAA
ncbi:TPA: hypothetical protein ACNUZI_001332 [Citrobacter braakii]|nr:hypothetical protein [Citrobacter sp. XY323]